MAVTIRNTDTHQCEFHRNPSGFHNKVNWILVKSEYNYKKIIDLQKSIPVFNNSWNSAFSLAYIIASRQFNAAKIAFPQHWRWIKKYVNSLRRIKNEKSK